MSNEMTVVSPAPAFELSVDVSRFEREANNRAEIKKFIEKQLVAGNDYGKIGNIDKNILLQPGAQKIASLLQVRPDYYTTFETLPNGHREYTAKVTLRHIGTGIEVGSGVGICSTMESKYRYRSGYANENTGVELPQNYFKLKKNNPTEAIKLIGGEGYTAEKFGDKWMIAKLLRGKKIENPDPADLYNTVLKMSMKRAFVQAILNVIGGWAGDQFSDVGGEEDIYPDMQPVASRVQTINKIIEKAQERNMTDTEARAVWGQVITDAKISDINKVGEDIFQEAVMDYSARIERIRPQ